MSKKPLITIGIIFGKNDLKYLPYSLKSIFEQIYNNFEVIMHNNVIDENKITEDDKVFKWIKENYPQVKLERSGNIGFGKAHNQIINQMKGDYYLCYNPDIILEPDYLEKLIGFLETTKEKNIGVIGGRIMYWDFSKSDTESQGKTNQIDSLGLKIKYTHRFIDINQGKKSPLPRGIQGVLDHKEKSIHQQPLLATEIFGLSGALFLAKKEALEDIAYQLKNTNYSLPTTNSQKEFFDETIFLYKEDIDLAYRFRLAGYKTFLIQDAVAYHDRSVSGDFGIINSRKTKKRLIKGQTINTWSFYHHHIMLYKNWQKGFSLKVKASTFFYELLSTFYLLIFEFSTFWKGWKLFKQNFSEIKKRKKLTVKKVNTQEIEKWMTN